MKSKYKPHPWLPFTVLFPLLFLIDIPPHDAADSWMPGLGDITVMRPPSREEEVPAPVLRPSKEKKRKRVSPSETPKPKKSNARKSKNNNTALPADVAQRLRDEEEENKNADYKLVARKRSTEVPKAADDKKGSASDRGDLGRWPEQISQSSEAEDASRHDEQSADVFEGAGSEALRIKENAPSGLALTLHRNTFSKSRAELSQCEANLQRLTEERNCLKLLSGQKEEEIKDLRAELVQQKAEKIEQLRDKAITKEAETLGWKQNIDRLASEKETCNKKGYKKQ
ncbi:binder of USO1 and GRH1 protein 1-like [Nicotiana sylvestris]|uniref:binder of USO1 and GRH1 protein 1-like n=1 Tax=Nicotiana sylvestris TaxID=4096 RepID=UPI00388C75AF